MTEIRAARTDDPRIRVSPSRRAPSLVHAFGWDGDTLNLSAFTMTRFGSVNGEVRHDAPPDPMPPQQ